MPSLQWTNPIIDASGPDPFIHRAEGRYWMVTTGPAADGRYLPIWCSDDLVTWTFVRGAVARGGAGAWNLFNFWAPEVLFHEGRYWLYYTAKHTEDDKNHSNRIGLAVSDRPEGPFEDRGVLVDHAALDASPFRDADGTLWLHYVTEYGNARGLAPGRIWVDRLPDPSRVADRAVCLVDRHFWQEGPVMMRQRDGRYRLTYSIGAWTNDSYRVVQAVGDRPDGPFVESEGVILQSTEEVKGPGHHNFFTGPDGEPWLVYHGWDPAMTARYPRMDRLWAEADGTLRTPGPTSTAQERTW
jgi:arabinan endo-1,5-alpha-L-arabinosidase